VATGQGLGGHFYSLAIGRSDVIVICGHVVRPPCCAASCKDLSRYLSKTESVCLRKAYNCQRQIDDLTVSAANVNISVPYIMAARTVGIDRNEQLRHCQPRSLPIAPLITIV